MQRLADQPQTAEADGLAEESRGKNASLDQQSIRQPMAGDYFEFVRRSCHGPNLEQDLEMALRRNK
jgi:hypothetical protein